MFEGYSAVMGVGKFPLLSMGGRVKGLACADPGARTPIGASGNSKWLSIKIKSLLYPANDHYPRLYSAKKAWVAFQLAL